MRPFSVASVATCDVALGSELSLRERKALMDEDQWGLLIDRYLWRDMTATDRERARHEFTRDVSVSGGLVTGRVQTGVETEEGSALHDPSDRRSVGPEGPGCAR